MKNYTKKYFKYKNKYLKLQKGGSDLNIRFSIDGNQITDNFLNIKAEIKDNKAIFNYNQYVLFLNDNGKPSLKEIYNLAYEGKIPKLNPNNNKSRFEINEFKLKDFFLNSNEYDLKSLNWTNPEDISKKYFIANITKIFVVQIKEQIPVRSLFYDSNLKKWEETKKIDKNEQIIEVKHWYIDRPSSFGEWGSYNGIVLKEKRHDFFGNCYELKVGPLETSKTIGKIGKDLIVKKVENDYIEIHDVKDKKILKLRKLDSCNNIDFINKDIDLDFKNMFINTLDETSRMNYKNFWKFHL